MLKSVSLLGIGGGSSGNLTVTDGTNTVQNVTLITLTGGIANISGTGSNAVLNVQSLSISDNVTTITNVTNITFNGGKISGNSVQVTLSSGTNLLNEVITSNLQSTVTISAISNAYRDLILIVRGRSNVNATSQTVNFTVNNDSGANYDCEKENRFGNTSSNGLTAGILGDITGGTAPANYPGGIYARFFDYRGTTFYKQIAAQNEILVDLNTKANEVFGTWWRNTGAITSMTINVAPFGFLNNCVVSLYGTL